MLPEHTQRFISTGCIKMSKEHASVHHLIISHLKVVRNVGCPIIRRPGHAIFSRKCQWARGGCNHSAKVCRHFVLTELKQRSTKLRDPASTAGCRSQLKSQKMAMRWNSLALHTRNRQPFWEWCLVPSVEFAGFGEKRQCVEPPNNLPGASFLTWRSKKPLPPLCGFPVPAGKR